jgi:hypothetical protein
MRPGNRLMRATASCCIIVTLGAAACNRAELTTPSAPTQLPRAIPNYAGSWHGTFSITQCAGRRHCVLSMGQQAPFSLLLQQTGARVDGVFHAEAFAIPVEGEVSAEGELRLTGRRASPGWYLPTIELTRFTARRDDTIGLVAELSYGLEYPPGTPPSVNAAQQTIGGRIVSASLGAPTTRNSFAGRWVGKVLINECSAEGWLFCYPEDRGEEWGYELTLTQAGDRVAGQLHIKERVNVTGTVSGDTLTLDPATEQHPTSSATALWHLRSWTMRKDSVGQVRGSMAYDRETVWANLPPFASRYRAEIIYGFLEP